MKTIVRRLTAGRDLKTEIEKIIVQEKVEAGVILSSVGCVSRARFRLADGRSIKSMEEPLEILSVNGTLSRNGCHLHVTYGDTTGRAWGGHLTEGNIVNTTCELVIGIVESKRFNREYDETTGYKELLIKE